MAKCENFWWAGTVYSISYSFDSESVTASTDPHNDELVNEIKRRTRLSPFGFKINLGFMHNSFPEDAESANRVKQISI